jgi:DNA repair protein RecN (Recombination protein N)
MSPFAEGLNAALIGAQEALSAIADYRESVEADPARLEQIEERLDVIRTLKKKYGDTVEDVFDYGRDLAGKIHDLTHSEELSEQLEGRIGELTARLELLCRELTDQRRKAAPGFENAVEGELADLAMVRTKFEVSIQPTDPGPNGADLVEFLISPNPGEPVKPLVKIASGGEMSRIMLALKTVTTRAQVPTLVFDEIDAGIGGRTAQVLGDKLASLSSKCQVMLVTHLPQVAGKAATHVSVDKVVENGRSYVRLRTLVGEDRVRELARMLGSEQPSSAATRHAREMLSLADQGNRQA